MKPLLSIVAFALIFSNIGCSHPKVTYDPSASTRENEKNGLQVGVQWLKNKKSSIDITLSLSSHYPDAVTIPSSSISLEVNGQKYAPKEADDILIQPEFNYSKLLIFSIPNHQKKSGNVTLRLDPILRNGKNVAPVQMTLEIP